MKATYSAAEDFRSGNDVRLLDITFREAERDAAERVGQHLVEEFGYEWILEEDDMFTLAPQIGVRIDEMRSDWKKAKKAAL